MKTRIITDLVEPIFETENDHSIWFGYYNYDPLNHEHTKMLCNRAPKDGVAPQKGVSIEVGYFDLQKGDWHHIGYSDSWNWQQGAMLQWLPGDGNENKVIYNCSKNNRLISQIVDIDTGETRDIDWAIYGITPDGKKSIALNLERSYWCRAYHYESVANPEYNCRIAEDDGIFEIDLINNQRKRIISIQDIINIDSRPEFAQLKHWVEHIMINKDGTKFCFLHRFSPEFDVKLYQTRLFTADIDGSNLQVIDNWDKVDWSHFGWSNKGFSIYTVENNRIASSYKDLGRETTMKIDIKSLVFKLLVKVARMMPASLRKKIKGGRSYYQYYEIDGQGKYHLKEVFNQDCFDIDGHPSFTNDGRYMITDSYPDEKQYQRLIVYDVKTRKAAIIAQLFAFYHGTPASCDLHPKLSCDNQMVVVDTAFDDKHHMLVFKLNWERIKQMIS